MFHHRPPVYNAEIRHRNLLSLITKEKFFSKYQLIGDFSLCGCVGIRGAKTSSIFDKYCEETPVLVFISLQILMT